MAEKISAKKAVIIGGSAGSLKVLLEILKNLRQDLDVPVIIVIHRKNDPGSTMIDVLAQVSRLNAKEAEDKEYILPGMIYLAPSGYHLMIEKDNSFSLDSSELVNFSRPSIDVSFQTAAEAYGAGLLAIVLSGANADGTAGCAEVKKNGGITAVQDPAEAETPYMPQQVIRKGLADYIGSNGLLIKLINSYS